MGGVIIQKVKYLGCPPPVKGPIPQGGRDPNFFHNHKAPKGSHHRHFPKKMGPVLLWRMSFGSKVTFFRSMGCLYAYGLYRLGPSSITKHTLPLFLPVPSYGKAIMLNQVKPRNRCWQFFAVCSDIHPHQEDLAILEGFCTCVRSLCKKTDSIVDTNRDHDAKSCHRKAREP